MAVSGIQPLGTLHPITLLYSLDNIPAELAFRFITGSGTRIRKLNCSLIEVRRATDFVLLDKAQHATACC